MSLHAAAENNLRWLLRPVQHILDNPNMTDFQINGVGEGKCFVDVGHGLEQMTLPYTFAELDMIAINAAALTGQDIAEDVPLVSTELPGHIRCEIARPSATPPGSVVFSIRKPKARTPTPDDLEQGGVFDETNGSAEGRHGVHRGLMALHRARRWREFLEGAIAAGLNVVFCGKVGTGKTHVMRAFTHAIPAAWRIITIEDAHELLSLPCPNVVHLLYSKGKQGASQHGAKELVEAAMRMSMDGIIAQELRDSYAPAYLNILESGHWGMTTTHADSPDEAYERIAGLIMRSPDGGNPNKADLMETLRRTIPVVVYCVREGKRRRIESILYTPPREAGCEDFPMAAE